LYNKLTHISSFFFKKITLFAKSAKDPLFFGITYKNKFKLIEINEEEVSKLTKQFFEKSFNIKL